MQEIINILEKWQTIAGAIVGGIFALGVVLIVARDARKREEKSAAMLLIPDLLEFCAAGVIIRMLAETNKIPEQHMPMFFAEKLFWKRPSFSKMFEASMSRVMPVHTELAAHLSLLKTLYDGLDDNFNRLSTDFEILKENNPSKSTRPPPEMEVDANIIYRDFCLAEKHATCAEKMISQFILGIFPTFNKIRRKIFPNANEKKCIKQLRKGSI